MDKMSANWTKCQIGQNASKMDKIPTNGQNASKLGKMAVNGQNASKWDKMLVNWTKCQ